MADVFISFSSKDAERVAPIHARLMSHGLDVWWMRNLLPGDPTITTVSRELVDARNVLLAWSRNAEQSPYVEGEIMHAFGARKLVPVRIEKWTWPAFLSSVQYVDLTPGDDQVEAWRQIDARLGQSAPGPATGPMPLLAAPRSAGPVKTLAAVTLLLVLALVAAFALAWRAIRDGDLALVQLVQHAVLVLPLVSAAAVLVAARRVWAAWRSRPARVDGAAR